MIAKKAKVTGGDPKFVNRIRIARARTRTGFFKSRHLPSPVTGAVRHGEGKRGSRQPRPLPPVEGESPWVEEAAGCPVELALGAWLGVGAVWERSGR